MVRSVVKSGAWFSITCDRSRGVSEYLHVQSQGEFECFYDRSRGVSECLHNRSRGVCNVSMSGQVRGQVRRLVLNHVRHAHLLRVGDRQKGLQLPRVGRPLRLQQAGAFGGKGRWYWREKEPFWREREVFWREREWPFLILIVLASMQPHRGCVCAGPVQSNAGVASESGLAPRTSPASAGSPRARNLFSHSRRSLSLSPPPPPCLPEYRGTSLLIPPP